MRAGGRVTHCDHAAPTSARAPPWCVAGELKKARANDGTIEFVSAETRQRFITEGAQCLVWNYLPQIVRDAADAAAAKDAPYATNEAQNEYLARDLTKLRPEPRAVWQAFGFHVNEGWRENGFSVAFANEERVFGRKSILKLARKYRQAAIYVYHFEPAPEGAGRDNNGYIVRELLWVGEDYGKIDEKDSTRMQILAAPPKTPLAAQEWRPAE